MNYNVAYGSVQGQSVAIFDADAKSRLDSDRESLLMQLTLAFRSTGRRVQKAALVFSDRGRLTYFGSSDLVGYLQSTGVPRWTHTVTL